MWKKSDLLLMRCMQDAAEEALSFMHDCSLNTFSQDKIRQYAILHRINTISELSSRVSASYQEKHIGFPWGALTAFKKRFRVEDTVESEKIWDVVHEELPVLIKLVTRILDEEDGQMNLIEA